jgi:hypothetical protein
MMDKEDCDHVMQCSNPADKWRSEMTVTLEDTLCQLQTDHGLARILMEGIKQWMQAAEQSLQVKQYPK